MYQDHALVTAVIVISAGYCVAVFSCCAYFDPLIGVLKLFRIVSPDFELLDAVVMSVITLVLVKYPV